MTLKSYLITQATGVAAFNAICNAAYTGFLWRGEKLLPYNMIGVDLALTPAWIGLLSVLFGTPFIRKALADGRMIREAGIEPRSFAGVVPRNLLLRGITAGVLCAILFALPLAVVLPRIGDGMFTPAQAVGTKVAITIAFSLITVPLVVIMTAADAIQPRSAISRIRH